jgi:PAS domain S-box-containing protein
MILVILFLLNIFHDLSNVLEWSGVSNILDAYEDYLEILTPAMWGVFLYAALQEIISTDMRRSEERLRLITSQTPAILWTADQDLRFTSLSGSPNIDLSWRFFPKEGQTVYEYFDSDDPQSPLIEAHLNALEGESGEFELNIKGVIFKCHVEPLFDKNEKLIGIIGTALDITRNKRNEEELKQSQDRYMQLYHHTPVMLHSINRDLVIESVNDFWLENLGYQRDEVIGRRIVDFLTEDSRRYAQEEVLPCFFKTGHIENVQYRMKRKNGEFVDVLLSATAEKDNKGHLVRSRTVMEDITVQRRTEKALRESEQRLQSILGSIHAGVLVVDPETMKIVETNIAATEMIGASRDQIVGLDCHQFFCMEENDSCPALSEDEKIRNRECRLLKKNGDSMMVLKTVSHIRLDGRDHLLESFIDLTERKKLETQFQQAQKLESIGTLAGGIAHDFNNLLMGIQGNASLLLLGSDDADQRRERLGNIENYVQMGVELTRQLLGLARGGKYEVKPSDINALIQNSLSMFGRTKKEINILTRFGEDIRTVDIDRGQIEQVLLNLFVNSWHAMPGGGDLSVETRNVTLDDGFLHPFDLPPGDYVQISVTDTGVGIDKENLGKIFDPFFTTKESERGTGLGLASAYGIIKNHNGIIKVYSEPGQGTTFSIYLPVSDEAVGSEKKAADSILMGQGKILLVDDEEMIAGLGREMLEKIGYEVLTACSGYEAIDLFRNKADEVDIVILDMIMPGMGGSDTFDRLRAIRPDAKILLSSGYSLNGQASEILKRGCRGFIQKPFKLGELSKKIHEILAT